MKKTTMMTALTTVLLLSGCACVTTEYKAFEGVQQAVINGKGGTKSIVDGMEVWDGGEPPRKFKVLGFIEDNRGSGWMQSHTSSVRDDVVEKARNAGGDAVVKMNTQSQLAEFYKAGGSSFNVYGAYSSTAYYSSSAGRNVSKYAVIQYLK